MTIPTQQQAYSQGSGTSPIPAFVFSNVDPGPYNSSYPLYQGWVNTVTKAIWYLEALISSDGGITAQWRAVGPIVISNASPLTSDYQYPIGQTWIDSTTHSYWGLVSVSGTTATWVSLGGGSTSGIVSVEVDGATAPGTNPVLPNGGGTITITGAQVASGSSADVIKTESLAANTITIEIQRATTAAVATVGDNGVCHFNSADFTVDANGFVSSIGGGFTRSVGVDANTAPGTDPVLPTAGGLITVTGAQVAAGGVGTNVIRTDSLAANTYTIEIQRSTSAATSTVADNGVSHFNSADFTVDANAFVSLQSSTLTREVEVDAHTAPGTDPVVPDSMGVITVTGGQVAAGTTANVIRTDSLAANTYTIEVQRSQAVATSTIGDNGVCHFDSSSFAVDANGFVTLAGGGIAIDSVNVDAHTAPGTDPVLPAGDGSITVTGGVVSAGTTPVQTNSLAANTYIVQVQTSQALAAADATKIGLCNFNSDHFTVDSTGFVALSGGGLAIDSVAVQTGTSPIAPTAAGLITINGAVVAAGTNPVRTDGTGANTMAVEVQTSQAIASTDATKIGLSAFDSGSFSVDANGFVTLKGGTAAIDSIGVDAATGPGTNPVLPDVDGKVNVTAAITAAGTTPIQTNSLAANTYTIQVQTSQAIAAADATKVGVCNFDSGSFGVDSTGFVTLKGGSQAIDSVNVDAHTAPGTDPVLPATDGAITVTGGVVAAGTTPVQTNSLAANTYTVQVQTSQALAAADATKIGLCNFNSDHFTVDATGFVALAGGGLAIDSIAVQTGTSPIAPTAAGLVTINGAVVAAGTNPVRTDGTGANTMALEIQTSQAIASTDATKIGLAAFDSTDFTVDANGFVELTTGVGGISSVAEQVFTSNGTYTPTAGMKYCIIECIGGGGAGGGSTDSGGGSCGGGGGAGGYARGDFSAATIGASQSVTIGAGGTANSGASGGAGGSTSVGALISAGGGSGGAGGTIIAAAGGAGGSATGSVSINGNGGGAGVVGGGSVMSGVGGAGPFGGAGAAVVTAGGVGPNGSDGNAGTAGGAGGSGSASNNQSNSGGAGGAGYVIITEYI